jgi:serine/threonine-protein kinase
VRGIPTPSAGFHGTGSGLHATSRQGGATPLPLQSTSRVSAPLTPHGGLPSAGYGSSPSRSTPSRSSPSRSTPSQQVRVDASPSGQGREVRLYEGPRNAFRVLRCTELSRNGMFIHVESGLPAVFSTVKLGLMHQGRELALTGDVVRHVTPEQSRAWGMPVGFAVQLGQLSSAQKDALGTLLSGGGAGSAPGPDGPDDPRAETVLVPFRKYATGSFYDLLGVFEDADFPEVRQRIRDAKKVLDELRTRALSGRQRDDLEAYDRRLDEAFTVVGNARNRLDYDGGRGNWKGAARCIAGGVSVTELDNARRRYLATRDRVEGTAHLHFTTGSAWENQKELQRAQQEFERALALDPLNLTFHQRYQALRRHITAPLPPRKKG